VARDGLLGACLGDGARRGCPAFDRAAAVVLAAALDALGDNHEVVHGEPAIDALLESRKIDEGSVAGAALVFLLPCREPTSFSPHLATYLATGAVMVICCSHQHQRPIQPSTSSSSHLGGVDGEWVELTHSLPTPLGSQEILEDVETYRFWVYGMDGYVGHDCEVGESCGSDEDCEWDLICSMGSCLWPSGGILPPATDPAVPRRWSSSGVGGLSEHQQPGLRSTMLGSDPVPDPTDDLTVEPARESAGALVAFPVTRFSPRSQELNEAGILPRLAHRSGILVAALLSIAARCCFGG
jgi:hypothetical protein